MDLLLGFNPAWKNLKKKTKKIENALALPSVRTL